MMVNIVRDMVTPRQVNRK